MHDWLIMTHVSKIKAHSSRYKSRILIKSKSIDFNHANYKVRKLFFARCTPHLAALPLADWVSFLLSFLKIPPPPPTPQSKQHNTHLLFLSSCNQLHFNNLSHSIFVLKNSTARICKKLTPEALATVPVSSLHHILPDISYKVSQFGLVVRR